MSIAQQFPYVGFFLLLVLGSIGLPVPEEATLLLGGYMIAQGTVEIVPALLFIYTGLLVSDFIIYYAGRKYGRALLLHSRIQRILPEASRLKIEAGFNKHGLLLILLGRHIIGFRTKLFLVAGSMGLSPAKFLAIDSVAALISMTIIVTLGYTGNDLVDVVRQTTWWEADKPEGILIAGCMMAIIFVIAARWVKLRRQAARRIAAAESDY